MRINEFLVLTVCNECDKNWKTNGRETTSIVMALQYI